MPDRDPLVCSCCGAAIRRREGGRCDDVEACRDRILARCLAAESYVYVLRQLARLAAGGNVTGPDCDKANEVRDAWLALRGDP